MATRPQDALWVAVDEAGIVVLFGELDDAGGDALEQAMLAPDVGRPLTLDLTGVTFMDSAGLRALLTVALAERKQGRSVVLAGTSGNVDRLLEVTRTRSVFAEPDTPARVWTAPA